MTNVVTYLESAQRTDLSDLDKETRLRALELALDAACRLVTPSRLIGAWHLRFGMELHRLRLLVVHRGQVLTQPNTPQRHRELFDIDFIVVGLVGRIEEASRNIEHPTRCQRQQLAWAIERLLDTGLSEVTQDGLMFRAIREWKRGRFWPTFGTSETSPMRWRRREVRRVLLRRRTVREQENGSRMNLVPAADRAAAYLSPSPVRQNAPREGAFTLWLSLVLVFYAAWS